MNLAAVLYLLLMAVGVAILVTMPIWAGWWKPKKPRLPRLPKNKGQRRGKRRLMK